MLALAAAFDTVIAEIRAIQREARTVGFRERRPDPMIVLRTPKGWTGPKEVDGKPVEGTFRSHQVPLNVSPSHPEHLRALHQPVIRLIRPLLKRGQASAAFNPDLPIEWMLTVLLELIHAASRDVNAGRLAEDKVEHALVASVLGALANPQPHRRTRR